MKTEMKIRDFSLRLISILVWFMILWATVFLVGMIFQWSGLTDQLAIAFFGSGFCAVLVLTALALLNVSTLDAGLPKFVPNAKERKTFERLIAGEITEFTVPSGGNLRAFRMVQAPEGKMILLVDTSRRSDYSRGSFK